MTKKDSAADVESRLARLEALVLALAEHSGFTEEEFEALVPDLTPEEK